MADLGDLRVIAEQVEPLARRASGEDSEKLAQQVVKLTELVRLIVAHDY